MQRSPLYGLETFTVVIGKVLCIAVSSVWTRDAYKRSPLYGLETFTVAIGEVL